MRSNVSVTNCSVGNHNDSRKIKIISMKHTTQYSALGDNNEINAFESLAYAVSLIISSNIEYEINQ